MEACWLLFVYEMDAIVEKITPIYGISDAKANIIRETTDICRLLTSVLSS